MSVPEKSTQERLFLKYTLFVGSGISLLLLFVWSFFEAGIWFLAPDFLAMLYCFAPSARLSRLLFVALAGSLVGGILYYILCLQYPAETASLLLATPFVSQQKIAFVSGLYESYGVLGAFAQSFTLIPFKIWTSVLTTYHLSPISYFLLVMLSRFIRFGVSGAAAIWIGRKLGVKLERYFLVIIIGFSVIFLTIQTILE